MQPFIRSKINVIAARNLLPALSTLVAPIFPEPIFLTSFFKKVLVKIDSVYFRPSDIKELRGDSTKAKKILKWRPKTTFKELVKEMMDNDLND